MKTENVTRPTGTNQTDYMELTPDKLPKSGRKHEIVLNQVPFKARKNRRSIDGMNNYNSNSIVKGSHYRHD